MKGVGLCLSSGIERESCSWEFFAPVVCHEWKGICKKWVRKVRSGCWLSSGRWSISSGKASGVIRWSASRSLSGGMSEGSDGRRAAGADTSADGRLLILWCVGSGSVSVMISSASSLASRILVREGVRICEARFVDGRVR